MRGQFGSMAAGLALASALVAAAFGSDDPRAERSELANGLDVILRPIEGGGPVALLVLYDLGEEHDPPGRSGLGHLIEHLYVTSAAGSRPATTAQEWMARYGSQVNAQTGRLYTVIAVVFDPDQLDAELEDAASRMLALRVEPADLDRELPRLDAELANMYGGIPPLAAQNLASDAAAPLAEGARRGGQLKQVRAATLEEIHDRLTRLYKPVNARLILAGGFDPAPTRARIEALFGPIPRGEPVPAPRAAATSRGGGTETISVPRPPFGEFPGVLAAVAWRVPAPGSPDYAPFLVMYGRLMEQVDRARLAIPPVSYAPLDRPEVLILGAEVPEGKDAAEMVAALRARAAEAVTQREGEPISAGLAIEQLGPMLGFSVFPDMIITQYPYGMAFTLGRRAQLAVVPTELEERLGAVSADDLRRLAETWFGPGTGAAVVVTIGGEQTP